MPTTLVAFGAALASSSDGIQEMFVAEVCAAIVVSAREPNFARSVCEKELDAGTSVIVAALPSVTADTLGVVALGIVGSVITIPPLAVPIDAEIPKFAAIVSVICRVPSELCAIVTSPYAALSDAPLSVRIVRYFVPEEEA
ncbi:hypothetical protein SDC9_70689 [bioreactor metagenome]|uniref:Uncharacterized protein n=1 Tax=bioreactor metagenome TaxID=1076179 RepID=A0A644Y8E6_9ZZZZ